MSLLAYTFCDYSQLALVEVRKGKKGLRFHIILLSEHLFDLLNKKLVLTEHSIARAPATATNLVDAIRITLHHELYAGPLKRKSAE